MKLFEVTARAQEIYYVLADDEGEASQDPNDKIAEMVAVPDWDTVAREVPSLAHVPEGWRRAFPFLNADNDFAGTIEDFFNAPPEVIESEEQRARRIREELEAAGQLRLDGGAA